MIDKSYVRVWAINHWESDPEKYGDATAIIQYGSDGVTIKHVVLIDTGMDGSDTIKKLKAVGVTRIDIVVISHDHSDHYGYLPEILKQFKVGHVYLPEQNGVRKYQPNYADRIAKLASKCMSAGVGFTFVSVGDYFEIGKIQFFAIFQAYASDLKERDNHHFINNMSLVYHVVIDGEWIFDFGGDLQEEGANLMIEALGDLGDNGLECDVFKIRWHGDIGAIFKKLAEALKCKVAFSNYHGPRSSGGRNSTYKVFEDVGALVVENYAHGEIYMDIRGKEMTVSGSKCGLIETFRKEGE